LVSVYISHFMADIRLWQFNVWLHCYAMAELLFAWRNLQLERLKASERKQKYFRECWQLAERASKCFLFSIFFSD